METFQVGFWSMGKTFFFREERICRNEDNENYCLQKEKFKVPQFGFLGKGYGKNLLFREERVCRNGNNENYCLQKEKFKIPPSRF